MVISSLECLTMCKSIEYADAEAKKSLEIGNLPNLQREWNSSNVPSSTIY